MISFLTNFYLANQTINSVVLIICYWLFYPGAMFFSARVFESRSVYLGQGQSRTFMPGDLMLGVAFSMIIGLRAQDPVPWDFCYQVWYFVVTAIGCAIIAVAVRIPDGMRYPKGSRNSPTKITHDFCGYFVSQWVLASLGIPQLVWAIMDAGFAKCTFEWIMIASATFFFLVMLAWDILNPPTKEERLLMHPDKYQPCWKKTKHL